MNADERSDDEDVVFVVDFGERFFSREKAQESAKGRWFTMYIFRIFHCF